MNLRTVIATATTAAVLATGGIALAGAADSNSTSSSTSTAPATAAPSSPKVVAPVIRHRHRVARRVRARAFVRKVVTDTIGIDAATLRADVRSGQTIAEIATAKGVAPQTVIDALVTAATTKLETAATNGRISSDRAHKIEAKLPARFTKLVNDWHPRRLRKQHATSPVA